MSEKNVDGRNSSSHCNFVFTSLPHCYLNYPQIPFRLHTNQTPTMRSSKLAAVAVASALLLLLLLSTPATSQEADDQREFSYESGSPTGPENWGNIHPEWAVCGNGKLQSPIHIFNEDVQILPGLGELRRSYLPANAVMVNRGHDISIKWASGAGRLQIEGKQYELKQLHWHSPSEHVVNWIRYPLELHMVHQSAGGELAVVGVLYRYGEADPFLKEIEKHLKAIEGAKEGEEEELGAVDPSRVFRLERNLNYYRYMGSLTTPPCSEGVIWTVMNKVPTVSNKQVELLRRAVHDGFEMNSRPTQPINHRTVGFYRGAYETAAKAAA